MVKTVAIIQARMNSTRLPGKVLMYMAGEPMLRRVIGRVCQATTLDGVIVATCYQGGGAIAAACESWEIPCWIDDNQDDVLSRYIAAAEWCGADVIVRVCADNPLIRPDGIDTLVQAHRQSPVDYVGFETKPGTPAITQGTGYVAEVCTLDALQRADRLLPAGDPHREHVTQILYADEQFRCYWLPIPDWYRTIKPKKAAVDTQEDFDRIAALMENPT